MKPQILYPVVAMALALPAVLEASSIIIPGNAVTGTTFGEPVFAPFGQTFKTVNATESRLDSFSIFINDLLGEPDVVEFAAT